MVRTLESIRSSLESIRPRERIVYHVGNLARDRLSQHAPRRVDGLRPRDVGELGAVAMRLYIEKKVHLVQRRIRAIQSEDYGAYEYIAIGR